MPIQRFTIIIILSLLLRCLLLIWGEYQDHFTSLPYTDIDYIIVSDAAKCIIYPQFPGCTKAIGVLNVNVQGIGDPYARITYRYTPLLAILAIPNILLHPIALKFMLVSSDLLVGTLLYYLHPQSIHYITGIWLLNPIIANISTRGSTESILGLIVISILVLAKQRRWDTMAIVFGLAVHFKLYPIIYGSSLLATLSTTTSSSTTSSKSWFRSIVNRRQIRFGVISFISFMGLNTIMYLM